jgi:hypothetical protein
MLRPAALTVALFLCVLAALGSAGARAAQPRGPDLLGVQAGPFSAVVKWRVDQSSRIVVEVGTDDRYGIWSPTTVANGGRADKTTLTGLEPSTTYRFRLVARNRSGLRSEVRGSFRTDPWPGSLAATVTPSAAAKTSSDALSPFIIPPASPPGGATGQPGPTTLPQGTPVVQSSAPLRVNGVPVFPRMVWRQCPTYYPTSVAAGINLFVGASCAAPAEQLAKLAGHAISAVDASDPGVTGPGLIGWHFPDEADVSVGDASKLPKPPTGGRVTFLTLTDHFSSRAAPPPNGKGIYPGFMSSADVIGFDTYPLEVRCTISQLDNVYWMQRELVQLAQGKPTFQWIEAASMEKCHDIDPTPAVVKAETWLAIAGGARGIGYFPDWWPEDIRNEVGRVNRDIVSLAPALLDQVVNGSWSVQNPVRIGIRRHNGAVYVIAVNTSTAAAATSFTVPGLGGRKLRLFGDGRIVTPYGDLAVDKLPPLGVAIYIASPLGW